MLWYFFYLKGWPQSTVCRVNVKGSKIWMNECIFRYDAERPRQSNVHRCGSCGAPGAPPHYHCLSPIRAREIKGNGITEKWCAAVLLMCGAHFHFIPPPGPKTFLLWPFLSLLASCSGCLLPIKLLNCKIPPLHMEPMADFIKNRKKNH